MIFNKKDDIIIIINKGGILILKRNELKDKISIAKYTLDIKKDELSKIKVNTFAYNPRITELTFEIKNLEQEIENSNKLLEELTDE